MKKSILLLLLLFSFVVSLAQFEKSPKGEPVSENFTGNVWMKVFISSDTNFNYHAANVTFGPGARTYWHSHPGGQVLIATEGIGYYQERGKPIQILRTGDVVKCLPDVEHWHGASPQSEFVHMGITNNHPKGRFVWMQPVTEKEYNRLK